MKSENLRIYIVSDATGETAEKVILSVLAQFKGNSVEIQKFTKVSTPEEIKEIIKKATHSNAFVVYTFAQKWFRNLITREAEIQRVYAFDIIGPLVDRFSQYLSKKPQELPGAQHVMDAEYFKRIEAIEYTVKHDDGQNPETIYDADIVLMGVSRTSKTPLSIYLSHETWKVANIPLVKGIEYNIDFKKLSGKIVGLTIDPVYLSDIRKARLKIIGNNMNSEYANLKNVYEEILFSNEFFRKHKIPIVDVTKKSIEESASEILKTLKKDKIRF